MIHGLIMVMTSPLDGALDGIIGIGEAFLIMVMAITLPLTTIVHTIIILLHIILIVGVVVAGGDIIKTGRTQDILAPQEILVLHVPQV